MYNSTISYIIFLTKFHSNTNVISVLCDGLLKKKIFKFRSLQQAVYSLYAIRSNCVTYYFCISTSLISIQVNDF